MTSAANIVVFDLDGTLIDSAPDIRAAANLVLVARGHVPLSLAETHQFIGKGAAHFIAQMCVARGIPADQNADYLEALLRHYVSAVTETTVYPHVLETLAQLRSRGLVLGICTNKPLKPTQSVLARFGLDQLFTAVVAGDSHSVLKPDPLPLQDAIAQCGSGRALFVGDSEIDAETAARAGQPFALFSQGYNNTPLDEIPHSARFDDFRELPEIVEHLLGG